MFNNMSIFFMSIILFMFFILFNKLIFFVSVMFEFLRQVLIGLFSLDMLIKDKSSLDKVSVMIVKIFIFIVVFMIMQ